MDVHSSLEYVWFLSKDGISPRNPWAYLRMMVVHHQQPWYRGMWKAPGWSKAETLRIGFAGFAEYQGSGDTYLEVSWDGKFGEGRRLTLAPDASEEKGELLWLS